MHRPLNPLLLDSTVCHISTGYSLSFFADLHFTHAQSHINKYGWLGSISRIRWWGLHMFYLRQVFQDWWCTFRPLQSDYTTWMVWEMSSGIYIRGLEKCTYSSIQQTSYLSFLSWSNRLWIHSRSSRPSSGLSSCLSRMQYFPRVCWRSPKPWYLWPLSLRCVRQVFQQRKQSENGKLTNMMVVARRFLILFLLPASAEAPSQDVRMLWLLSQLQVIFRDVDSSGIRGVFIGGYWRHGWWFSKRMLSEQEIYCWDRWRLAIWVSRMWEGIHEAICAVPACWGCPCLLPSCEWRWLSG